MSTSTRRKHQKIEEEQPIEAKPEKKQKNKKKKKDHQNLDKNADKASGKSKQTKISSQKTNGTSKQEDKPKPCDSIAQELLSLDYDGLLTPCQRSCQLINSHLQQVTINLYELMIMKSSLIESAIKEAKQSSLTPKEYFSIDYTNKLLLIKRLLVGMAANKYKKFVDMIDAQVYRVQQMILQSLENVRTFEEVLVDLKKNNVEWDLRG